MSPSESASDDSTALAGRTIAVPETRQLDVLASLLERRGAAVLRCPLVGIRDAPDQQPVIAWVKRRLATPSDDLIVFYTGEGVEVTEDRRASGARPTKRSSTARRGTARRTCSRPTGLGAAL